MNPYKWLATCMRSQLRIEENLGNARKHLMWMQHVDFCGTSVVVGKGGINTIFYKFGSSERKLDYPANVLALLDRLSRQEFPYYRICLDVDCLWQGFLYDRARKYELKKGMMLYGVDFDNVEHAVFKARRNIHGSISWVAVRSE